MPTCPAGHDSTSADFCDVCGLVIGATASPAPPVVTAPELPAETCPECGEPRTGRFCEGCSYDFVAGARRTPVAAAPVAAAPVAAVPAPAAVPVTSYYAPAAVYAPAVVAPAYYAPRRYWRSYYRAGGWW